LNILLASHGTPGAQAAERQAYELCFEYRSNCEINFYHLYVIPELWGTMLADDWLNNASTQLQFENHLEAELRKEANDNTRRVQHKLCELNLNTQHIVKYGEPKKCLLNACNEIEFDLVILGSRRPKNISGLNSCMLAKSVVQELPAKLLQVPYPLHK